MPVLGAPKSSKNKKKTLRTSVDVSVFFLISTSRHRQVTDLDVTVLGFSGQGLPSARQVLCGDAPRLFSIILVCV